MLNKNGESKHPCLTPDLRGKVFNLSLMNMMLAVGWSYMAFIKLRYVPSICNLLQEKMLYFVKCFFCIYWDDPMILSFIPLMWCISHLLICICWLPLHPRDKYHLIVVNDLSNMLLIRFANILLRSFASLFIRDIGLQFSFLIVSLSGFCIRVMLASKKMSLGAFPPSSKIFGIVWEG